ncbi:DNA repair protein RecO [Aestuariimicrobium ganziense]|uniref:DNA repair protein RecO n=1 Tax=Aestuariimicrobium ganziense TaxID=2773677 RepID=UPI001941C710|nr:DNA repair protein RecO [Aestuariimicrobium ganziense]
MPTYRDEAIVLRTHKLGEADRIITLFTRRHGKVRAVARGVRRTSSKFGGRLEPFSHVDLQLVAGRTLDIVAQCVQLHAWAEPLMVDYQRYTVGTVMLETADKLVTVEYEPAVQQYLLLAGAVRTLGEGTPDGPRPPEMILDSYLLRALSIAGYAPSLSDCAVCGAEGPHPWFAPVSGGVVCDRCRPPGSARVSPAALALLVAELTGEWEATRDLPSGVLREASGLVAAFVAWHLDRGLRSFSHLERS